MNEATTENFWKKKGVIISYIQEKQNWIKTKAKGSLNRRFGLVYSEEKVYTGNDRKSRCRRAGNWEEWI